MTILVTGFEPVDDGLNASKILIESLRDNPPESISGIQELVHYVVLPASTHQLKEILLQYITRYKPDYCIFIGQAPGRNKITLERLASNLKDFGLPDALGSQPQGELIEQEGAAAYWSSLPNQQAIVKRLLESEIPAAFSNHAGNHLCNQLFYHALHYANARELDLKCGFIHIPLLPIQIVKQWQTAPFIPLGLMRDAMTLILTSIAES